MMETVRLVPRSDGSASREVPVRLGIAGCGEIAPAHARVAAVCRRTQLTASRDIDPIRARAFARTFGCDSAPSLQELLRHCDAVVVCTPLATHTQIVLAACGAGRHVLCEKELAPDLEQCHTMLAAAEQAGVRSTVGFRLRHDPFLQRVRSSIRTGSLGEGTLIHLWLPRSLDTAVRLNEVSLLAGVTVRHGCHGYDLVRFLMGRPDVVVGLGANRTRRLSRSDDTAVVGFRWGSALGTLVIPWSAGPTSLDRRMETFDSRGHLSADYVSRTIRLVGPESRRRPAVAAAPLDVPAETARGSTSSTSWTTRGRPASAAPTSSPGARRRRSSHRAHGASQPAGWIGEGEAIDATTHGRVV